MAKRPGTFKPKLSRRRDELAAEAAALYGEAGLTMRDVAAELAVSTTTVRQMLHEAGVTMRSPGVRRSAGAARERRLLNDLYPDPDVVQVLRRFDVVVVQSPQNWTRPDPLEAIAPLLPPRC